MLTVDADLGDLPPEEAEPDEVPTDDTDQPLPEHDGDPTLLQEVFGSPVPADHFTALSLMERLDVASNPALDQASATLLFDTEAKNRKSKRVLGELDRRLQLLRSKVTAQSVTDAMIKTNFPRAEER